MMKTSKLSIAKSLSVGRLAGLIGRLPVYLLYAVIFLMPLAFWPSQYLLAGAAKKYLFIFLVIALAVSLFLSRSKSPTLTLPSKWWLLALWIWPIIATISALLSGAPLHSLIGLGVENDTAWSFLFWALFATTAAIVWLDRRLAGLYVTMAVLSVGVVVALFQWIKLLAGNFTQLAVFANPAANLIGKWNEFGLFMGLIAVLALAFLEFLPWRRMPLPAILAWLGLGLALVSLVIVNYWYSWLLVALAALLIGLIKWIKIRRTTEPTAPTWRPWFNRPAIVLALALVLVLIGNQTVWPAVSNRLGLAEQLTATGDKLGIQVLEVSPSWRGTGLVAAGAIKENPLIGTGPNKFTNAWFKHRPDNVNQTPFWNLSFDYGIGFWPSLAVTMGLLGLIAVAYLVLISAWQLFKILFVAKFQADVNWPFAVLAGLGLFYLFAASIIYPTGTVILAYLFAFLALFIALTDTLKSSPGWEIKWARTDGSLPVWKVATGSVIGLLIVLLFAQNLLAAGYFSRALAAVNRDGDLVRGEILLAKASSVNGHSLFYRSLVDVELGMLNDLLNNQGLEPEEAQLRFQNTITALVDNSRRATDYNPTNYLNWQYQGLVFESLVPLEIEGAYEAALSAYNQARVRSGDLASVLLSLARLEIAAGNTQQARTYLAEALTKKPNYTDAIFVLTQIEANAGNLRTAIELSEQAVASDPGNPTTFFALGLLKYQNGDYSGAATALEQALNINSAYANARYFLGLAYDQLGFTTRALEQFRIILTTNDLPEIKQIITNLEAGRDALTNTEPPAPEDREELPVPEDN